MKQLCLTYLKKNLFILISIFALMIFTGSAFAGDYMMQKNLNNLSDMNARWSKQLSTGKLTPEAQKKLAELLSQTSQVLKDMSEKSGEQMHMDHSAKIDQMNKEWDPFDTSGGM
jgi:hypothetical protein